MSMIPPRPQEIKSPLPPWPTTLVSLTVDDPEPPLRAKIWTWLCDRLACLRSFRGHNACAREIDITDDDRAKLLAMLCDAEVREAVAALLAPDLAKRGRP